MKKFLGEFEDFINRGNVMDLAVAVIIGGAFTAIVTALTTNIINPFISFIAGGTPGELSGLVVPGTEIDFGAFISAVINFLIVAFVLFVTIKAINMLHKKPVEEPKEPTTKKCPYCQSEIAIKAVRCPHCTSKLEGFPEAKL